MMHHQSEIVQVQVPSDLDRCHRSRMSDRLALTLRQAIRAERARQGLTQEDLAKKLGWTRQVVWTVETGARTVAMHEMPDICRALGVTLSRLLVDAAAEDRDALGI
jgi:ribosome-binding protein aMBF1 (putative translation factor)